MNGEPEWEASKVLASRIYRGKLQYKVDWVGYDPDNTFYDAQNFIGSPFLIKDFHEKYPEAPGPPVRLQAWIEAFGKDEPLTPCNEDNKH